MKGRKILAWLLAMTMVLTMFPAVTLAATASTGEKVTSDQEWDRNTIIVTSNPTSGTKATTVVGATVTISGTVTLDSGNIRIGDSSDQAKDVTIMGNGSGAKLVLSYPKAEQRPVCVIYISNYAGDVTLKDLAIEVASDTTLERAVILIDDKYTGKLTLDNVTISGNKVPSADMANWAKSGGGILWLGSDCKIIVKNNLTFSGNSPTDINLAWQTDDGTGRNPFEFAYGATVSADTKVWSLTYKGSKEVPNPVDFATGDAIDENFAKNFKAQNNEQQISYYDGKLWIGPKTAAETYSYTVNLGNLPANTESSGGALIQYVAKDGGSLNDVTVTPSSGNTFTGVDITALQTELKKAALEAKVNTDGAIVISGKPSTDVNLSNFDWPTPVAASKKVVLGNAEDLDAKGLELESDSSLSQEIGNDGTFATVTIKAKNGKMPLTDADVKAINDRLGENSPLGAMLTTDGKITISQRKGTSVATSISADIVNALPAHNDIVAAIDGTSYDKLEIAISKVVSGKTVEMKANPSSDVSNVALANGAALKDTNSKTYTAAAENTKISVDKNGKITLNSGKLETSGAITATVGGKSYSFSTDKGTYTVDAAENTLTVPANTTVTDGDGVKYTGEGIFTFGQNGKVTLSGGANLTDKNNKSITGVDDDPATVVTLDNGEAKLTGGKGSSNSGMTAAINGVGDKAFIAENAQKYTVDTAGKLITDEAGSVTMENTKFTGAAGDGFQLGKSTSGNTTATIPGDATVSGAGAAIKGVTPVDGKNPTTVSLDTKTGEPTLVAGKGAVTGKAIVKVAVKGSDGSVKTVDVTIPADKTYTIDADNMPPMVGKLAEGESITLGDITYTAGANDTEFPIGTDKLVNVGDKATVPGGKDAEIALGNNADAPVITVPSANTNSTTITKGDASNPTTVQVPANGAFTLNGKEYAAGDEGATFVVDETNKTASLESGNAVVEAGDTLGVKTGDTFVPVKATDKDIVVKANDPAGKSSATVPANGSVSIGSGDNIKTYPSKEDNTEFVFDKDGNVTLTDGTTELDKNKNIIGGGSGKDITNSGEEGTIEVKANDPQPGKDTVKVPAGGKVKIGDAEYDAVSEATIVVGSDGNKLTKGSVKLDSDETVNVGSKDTPVKNTGNKQIEVSADGKVTVPTDGQTDIGKAKITDVKQDTIFTIGEDGNAKVALGEGESVTINGVVYTGGEGGGTVTVNPETGKVTGIDGNVNIAIDEAKLTDDFSYELVPGQSVTIGKYVYTAPSGNGAQVGDVTITGRGMDDSGNALNPKVTLKNAKGSVEVALSADKATKTTYTAENANTMFAMSANDTDTTKVDLSDNGNSDSNSTLKFTDKAAHTVNGVTYQAQTVNDAETGEEKAVSYTVTYGTRVENGETVNGNKVDVESGSKVIATMNSGDSVQAKGKVGDNAFANNLPFIATNNGASIIIDSSTDGTNNISGNRSYLTEIKDEAGNITGYEVRRRSSGGGGGGSSRYTVSFETNGGSKLSSQTVTVNTAIKEPTAPTKDGYDFAGWYTDKELTTKYDFSTKVAKSFTLYAAWTEKDNSENQFILTIGKKDAQVWGKTMTNDVAPQIVKDRTMLPARFVAENLGAKVDWNGENQLVTITGKNEKNEDVTILITIGSDTATVNGKSVKLDSPAFVENDRTYTPIRFISERIGAKVEWNETEQKVIITKLPLTEEK